MSDGGRTAIGANCSNSMSTTSKYATGCVALVLYLLAAGVFCIGYLAAHDQYGNVDISAEVVGFVLSMVIGAIARMVQTSNTKQVMATVSGDALALKRQLASGRGVPPFFLYLRSFSSDSASVENPAHSSMIIMPGYHRPGAVAWETFFAKAVERYGRLISLGTVTESATADRIVTSDREWRNDFILLATFADAIFIQPSARAGTLWEIEWLKRKLYLSKCIFVIRGLPDEHELRAIGVSLPPESRDPFFTIDSHGNVTRLHQGVNIRKQGRVLSAVADLVSLARANPQRDFASSWKRFQADLAELPQEPATKTNVRAGTPVDVRPIICVECGRRLYGPVCAACERQNLHGA